MKSIEYKLMRIGKIFKARVSNGQMIAFSTDVYGDIDLVTSPIFDDESFYSDGGFDFLGEIEEVAKRPWEIAPLDKKLRVIFLLVMIIIGPEIRVDTKFKCGTRHVSHSYIVLINSRAALESVPSISCNLRLRSPAEFYNFSNIITR